MVITVYKEDTKELIASVDEDTIILKDGYEVLIDKNETEASETN